MAETTTQLFLAIRFNCNKCHDHPFERWTQDQYYQTASYFAQVALEPDPESKGQSIGGSAVEGATPLYESVTDKGTQRGDQHPLGTARIAHLPFRLPMASARQQSRVGSSWPPG